MIAPPPRHEVPADIDGDGQLETVIFTADAGVGTLVVKGSTNLWSHTGSIDGWNRQYFDWGVGVDVDGDGRDEVVIYNDTTNWTGILKWVDGALHCPWASPSPLTGPAGEWNRRAADGLGLTRWQGKPAVAIAHFDPADRWYGTLAWLGNRLGPVAIWRNGYVLRKFTFLYDMLEIVGTVTEIASAGKDGPVLDISGDPGFQTFLGAVNTYRDNTTGRFSFHCEAYPGCIATTDQCGPVVLGIQLSGEDQINHMVPFEPWPGTSYYCDNGGAPVQATLPNGTRRELQVNDRVRVRGRLLIENGHPQPAPPAASHDYGNGAAGVGTPFVELHPFDWQNIELDPIPVGVDAVRTHTLFLIAPVYRGIEVLDFANDRFADQRDRFVYVNSSVLPYSNTLSTSVHFDAPDPLGVAGQIAHRETVIDNLTGKPLDDVRTITTTPTGIQVDATVEAAPEQPIGPFPVASPDQLWRDQQRAVLQLKYDVYWKTGTPLRVIFAADNPTNTLLTCSSEDGEQWSGAQQIQGQSTKFAPAATLFKGRLWAVFAANNDTNNLLVCSSEDGQQWTAASQIPGQSTKFAPAIAAFKGRLWAVFAANNDTSNLLVCSSEDGQQWTAASQIPGQSTKFAPAIGVHQDQLWAVFAANNDTSNLLACASVDGQQWSGAGQIPGQSTKFAPAAMGFNSCLWVAFAADNDTNTLLVCTGEVTAQGMTWSGAQQIAGQSTKDAPSLAVFDGRLWAAFVADNETNSLLTCSSPDGRRWTGASQITGQSSQFAPGLVGANA